MATTTKKATKKTTAKRTSGAAKKSTAKRATKRATTAKKPSTPALHEREPKTLAEDATYAVAGFAAEAVEYTRSLPTKVEGLVKELEKLVERAPKRAKGLADEAPAKAKATADDVRSKLIAELEKAIAAFERVFDEHAAEGRKLVTELKKDQRVSRVLDQTGNSRSQVKAAVTSVTKTFDVALDAGRKQADVATSQVKAAVTSLRRSGETIADAVEETVEQAD